MKTLPLVSVLALAACLSACTPASVTTPTAQPTTASSTATAFTAAAASSTPSMQASAPTSLAASSTPTAVATQQASTKEVCLERRDVCVAVPAETKVTHFIDSKVWEKAHITAPGAALVRLETQELVDGPGPCGAYEEKTPGTYRVLSVQPVKLKGLDGRALWAVTAVRSEHSEHVLEQYVTEDHLSVGLRKMCEDPQMVAGTYIRGEEKGRVPFLASGADKLTFPTEEAAIAAARGPRYQASGAILASLHSRRG